MVTVDDAIRAYLGKVSLPASDVSLFNALLDRWKGQALTSVNCEWTERWITAMKRRDVMAPSTIRHYVGALARCFDWTVKSGNPSLPINPLRLLLKRYASYPDEDSTAVRTQGEDPKVGIEGDELLHGDLGKAVRAILDQIKPETASARLSSSTGAIANSAFTFPPVDHNTH